MADYPVSIDAVRKMLIDLRSSLGNERYISIGLTMALAKLEGIAPMDTAPRVHAYWMDGNYCSYCRAAKARPWAEYLESNANTFCHVCGAKMDAKQGWLSEFAAHVARMSDEDVRASIQKAERLTAGCASEEETT